MHRHRPPVPQRRVCSATASTWQRGGAEGSAPAPGRPCPLPRRPPPGPPRRGDAQGAALSPSVPGCIAPAWSQGLKKKTPQYFIVRVEGVWSESGCWDPGLEMGGWGLLKEEKKRKKEKREGGWGGVVYSGVKVAAKKTLSGR